MQNQVEEDIELALIGCYMLDFEAAANEAADFSISAEMFASPKAKAVFEAAHALHAEKRPVDPLTVRERLGPFDGSDATLFLTQAIDVTPTVAHTAYYAQLVRQKHETRRLRGILHAAARRLDELPADMVQADLMRQLEKNDNDPAKDGITFAEATDQAVDTFKKAAAGNAGLKTGFAFIDTSGGVQEGELIIISGKAGSCKTTLARQILTHVCSVEKVPSALITLEMTEAQIAAQTLTDQSQTSQRKFMAGVATEQDWARLFAAKAKAEKWPLSITAKARTPNRLSAYVRKVVRRGAKLIVLDYLQAMQPNADMVKANSEAQTTFASNTVRDLAVNLGVRFIVVCTENREGDLRYSDAIRYDAWKWFRMIQPEENNDDNPVFHLDVVKNRFGPVPKNVRQLYRVGNRLLTSDEWLEHVKTSKGRKDGHQYST
jgi:replicative DNA helicase